MLILEQENYKIKTHFGTEEMPFNFKIIFKISFFNLTFQDKKKNNAAWLSL